MTTARLEFSLWCTGPDLCVCVRLDNNVIYQGSPGPDPEKISHDFDDAQTQQHLLCIELSGKRPEHTRISETGEILEDRLVHVDDLCFDGISLGHVITKLARYTHDTNGTAPQSCHEFYGVMGCNGAVTLEFSTPVYLWLLENM
jgi:hypothetical protein